MSFEYFDPATVQFGVVRGALSAANSVLVPVERDVQTLLEQMVVHTRDLATAGQEESGLALYDPSQEHRSDARAQLPLDDSLALRLREFYEHENLPIDATVMRNPGEVTAYFCIIHDQEHQKLVGIRRAATFKAVLKARLIRLANDSLRAVDGNVFRLDAEFDLLIADDAIVIAHVPGFEQLADIDEAAQAAALQNAQALAAAHPMLGFSSLATYVSTHKRAARIVAALRRRTDLAQTSVPLLKRFCRRLKIPVQEIDGKLQPDAGAELAYLQVLDRRRYPYSLVPGRWELYEASSRKGIGVYEEQQPAPVVAKRKRAGSNR